MTMRAGQLTDRAAPNPLRYLGRSIRGGQLGQNLWWNENLTVPAGQDCDLVYQHKSAQDS